MRNEEFYKLPRLYVDAPLKDGDSLPLSVDHAHYLRNVMRKSKGDQLRLFNGRDGEALATLSDISKKAGAVETIEISKASASGAAAHSFALHAAGEKAPGYGD